MAKPTDLKWRDYFWHWLRFWCGMKLKRQDGEVVVEMKCRVCMKNSVTPQAWERINSLPRRDDRKPFHILDQ